MLTQGTGTDIFGSLMAIGERIESHGSFTSGRFRRVHASYTAVTTPDASIRRTFSLEIEQSIMPTVESREDTCEEKITVPIS